MPRISITTNSGTVAEIIEVDETTLERLLGKGGTEMQRHGAAISLSSNIENALRTASAMEKRGD